MLPGWPWLSSSSLTFPCADAWGCLDHFHCPQLGAARRRVLPDFLLAGRQRLFGEYQSPACTLQLPETLFDLAVLERHERDDDDPATRLHHERRAIEQRVELFLLPIDHHSQRHESTSRGVERSRPRCGPFHYTRQVQCAPNGPRSNDCSGYLPRSPFFAELVEPVGEERRARKI